MNSLCIGLFSDAMDVEAAPMNLHVDVKPGVSPLDALSPLHVAAASAERLHNGLRADAEADDKGVLIMAGIARAAGGADDKGHPERKRRASNDSLDVSVGLPGQTPCHGACEHL